jgi:hypothetical protein
MYPFLLNLWVAGRITEEKLREYAGYGFITEDEVNLIIATPKMEDDQIEATTQSAE